MGLIQQSAWLALVVWKPLRSYRGGGGSKAQSKLAGLGQSAWELLHFFCGKGISICFFSSNILTAFYISWLPQATG